MRFGLAVCAIALLGSGCTLFDRQEKRINYTERLDAGAPSLVTDAKQRVIVNTEANVGVGDFKINPDGSHSGVTSDQVVKNHPSRIICAEPSPDVAQAISAAFTAAAQVDVQQAAAPAGGATVGATQQASGSGSLGSSYAASIAQLGERLATVQLLRDKMYRACEAYQNGAISDTSYTLMLSRFDKTMSSMLAAEVAAGAFGRNLAALGGSAATSGADPKKLAEAGAAVKAAAKKLQDAAALPDSNAGKKAALDAANAELNTALATLAELEFQSARTMAQSGPLGGGAGSVLGQIVGRGAIDADTVALINTNYLDDDATGTIIDACVVALDRNRSGGASPALIAQRDALQRQLAEIEDTLRIMRSMPPDAAPAPLPQPGEIPPPTEEQLQQQAEAARGELARLQAAIGDRTASLGDVCAGLLQNADNDSGLIGVLQQSKLALRNAQSSILVKLYEAEAARAAAAPDLAKICLESTKAIADPTQRADKYMACIAIMPGAP
jgi:hypothetical protein